MNLFIAWDGDHIGRMVGQLALADDAEGLRRVSQAIENGNTIWASWVNEALGEMISFGGDEGRASVPADKLDELEKVRHLYATKVGSPVSVGVGLKLSEADRALLAAKLRGGDQIVLYTPEVEELLKDQKPKEEREKLLEEYLGKADGEAPPPPQGSPAPEAPQNKPNAGGGFTGISGPGGEATPDQPVAEASEHSQGESMRAVADNAPTPEGTHAASDFEDELHQKADEQSKEDDAQQQQGDARAQARQKVVEILSQVKQYAPQFQQLQQQAPELFEATQGLVAALLITARGLVDEQGDGQEQSQDSGQEQSASVQKSELLKNAAPGDPSFDGAWNVVHEANHGTYRTTGALRRGAPLVQVLYAPKRTGKFQSVGFFGSKQEAEAARLHHHDKVAAGMIKTEILKFEVKVDEVPLLKVEPPGMTAPPKPAMAPAMPTLKAPAPAGPAPLHATVEGFMGGLKALPKEGPARGKFITAHMNHGPFLSALQAHPQGPQVHKMLTTHLNSVANAGVKPGATQVTAKSEDQDPTNPALVNWTKQVPHKFRHFDVPRGADPRLEFEEHVPEGSEPEWHEVEHVPTHTIVPQTEDLAEWDGRGEKANAPGWMDSLAAAIGGGKGVAPIIVNERNGIVDGNHRFHVARKLGLKTVPVIRIPSTTQKSERLAKSKQEKEWRDCNDKDHWWMSDGAGEYCGGCGADRGIIEKGEGCKHFYGKGTKCLRCKEEKGQDLEKGKLPMPEHAPKHTHLNLPVGASKGGKVKITHEDGKSGWVSVRAGQVLSNDGHPISSRNPGGR